MNFTPYFFECFLAAPVFNLQTVVQIGNGEVVFKLNKQDAKVWDQLQNPDSGQSEVKLRSLSLGSEFVDNRLTVGYIG